MEERASSICSRCGAQAEGDSLKHLCLNCLLSYGLKGGWSEDECDNGEDGEDAQNREEFERFKVLGKLGEGGCGIVYRAEQLAPVRREVALKVIKLGMDTPTVVTRFETERQALALMDHAGIAKVFEAGATRSGRPFFAMELVPGEPITAFCETRRVGLEGRLRIFVELCSAVQHAHQKGVIHRDLKPSNVLVVEREGVAHPKVIDFGIAKATSRQRLADQTIYTAFDQFVGTPAYMSPEQAGLTADDVDTRTDVYALGVLLYELLAGVPPFDPQRLRSAAIDEVCRTIRDEEPVRPSLALQNADSTGGKSGVARGALKFGADLDWIVMKAIEKQPGRRYDSASEFAQDVARHLAEEPVLARPPSWSYRANKFLRRNKAGFLSGALVFAALVGALAISISRYRREREARQTATAAEREARVAAARSKASAAFMQQMLGSVSPSIALGRDTTLLREVLDQAARRISDELKEYPEAEADLSATLGRTYYDLKELDKAEGLQRRALNLRTRALGATNELVARSLLDLATFLNTRASHEDLVEAESLARQAIAVTEALHGKDQIPVAQALDVLSWNLWAQERRDESEILAREALRIRRKTLGPNDPELVIPLSRLGLLYMQARRNMAEAENYVRQALTIQRATLPERHPSTLETQKLLAMLLQIQGHPAEAEQEIREVLAARKALLRDGNETAPSDLELLATVLRDQKKFGDAESTIREAIELQTRLRGPDHPHHIRFLQLLTEILSAEEKWTEAEVTAHRWAALCRNLKEDPQLRIALYVLSRLIARQERWAEAEPLLRERLALCLHLSQALSGSDLEKCLPVRRELGECLFQLKDFAGAEPFLKASFSSGTLSTNRTETAALKKALGYLAAICEETGRKTEAAMWLQKRDNLAP